MTYIVTRQLQWSTGAAVVEISEGGWDYTNPDALSEKYPGEFQEYDDPREAVKTAIAVANAWQKDEPTRKIGIGAGFTGGYTMPFEPQKMDKLKKWAKEEYLRLPKCARCGKLIEDSSRSAFRIEGFDEPFCSEFCADETYHENCCEQEG